MSGIAFSEMGKRKKAEERLDELEARVAALESENEAERDAWETLK